MSTIDDPNEGCKTCGHPRWFHCDPDDVDPADPVCDSENTDCECRAFAPGGAPCCDWEDETREEACIGPVVEDGKCIQHCRHPATVLAAARREVAEAMREAAIRFCRERADTHAKTSDGFAARCMTDAAREYGAKAVALRDATGALNALPLPGEPPAKESK